MKIKSVAALTAAGMALATAAQAQVDIKITGSTAFRKDTHVAISNLFSTITGTVRIAPAGADLSAATNVTFTGTMAAFPTKTVTVRTSFSGSVEGIVTLTGNTTMSFLNADGSRSDLLCDLALSDAKQASTVYNTPVLSDIPVGVIPFVFAKNVAAKNVAGLDNMTDQLFNSFINLGIFPLSSFTGNVADNADLVNLVGRNSLSGTRLIVLAETGAGVLTPVAQRKLNLGNGTTGTTFVDDLNGFTSGGNVKTVLNATTTSEYAIGYMGVSDANGITGGQAGGAWMKYNGVDYSMDNIRNGKYTLWGYEHILNRTPFGTDQTTYRNALVSGINTELASSTTAIQLTSMNVTRQADGGAVTP